MEAAKNEI